MSTQQFLVTSWRGNHLVWLTCAALFLAYGITVHWRFTRKVGYFIAGLVMLVLTLASPLDTLANGYLFSAHMLQHLLLLLIVPPLFLLSVPANRFMPTRSGPLTLSRRWLARNPWLTWLMGVGAMWLWHVPTMCNASLANPILHRIQFISLVIMGCLFWWPIISPYMEDRLMPLTGIIYLFSACIGCTLLGIYLTFTPISVCSIYMHPADPLGLLPTIRHEWGLNPALDQQLGGLLMWVPACVVYLTGVIGLLARWYGGSEGATVNAAQLLEIKSRPSLTPTP